MTSVSELVRILEDLVNVPTYSVVGLATDRVAYVSNEGGFTALWSLEPVSGERVRLTPKPIHSVARPRKSSPLVVFTRDVAAGRELQVPYVVDVRGGEEEVLADVPPMRFFGMVWDGERLVFSGSTAEGMGIYLARRGYFEKLMDLKVIAYPTDIEGDIVVGAGMLRGDPRSAELFIYDLGTGDFSVYTPKEGSVNKEPAIKGGKLLFESNFEGKNKLYVYDPGTGDLSEAMMRHRDYAEYAPTESLAYGWTDDGRVWVVAKKDGRTRAFIDGKAVPAPEGTVGYLAIDEDRARAYYSASSLVEPPKIFEADLGSGNYRVIIDNPLPESIRGRLGRKYFTRIKSFDGSGVPTYVVESLVAGKPGPGVVYVHGGPWSEVYDSWRVMIAALVAAGYHVVAPNFRGSTGYGEDWRLADIGDPGGGDLEDVAAAAEWAKRSGLINKVAIMGYSYGGYMTYLALGKKPDIWDAGVAGAGITDWVEMYGLSDALFKEFIKTLFGGLNEELMKDRSPIKYVENVKAPLCIIHPQNDTRTPLKPVLKYMNALLEKGAEFEAHIVPGMGHVIRTVRDATKILLPALLFLNEKFSGKTEQSLVN